MADGINFPGGILSEPKLILDPAAPLESAREFIRRHHQHHGVQALHHLAGAFFVFRGTHYAEAAAEEVRADAYQFLDAAFRKEKEDIRPFNPNKAKVGNVMEALQAEAQLVGGIVAPAWLTDTHRHPPAEYVACQNGLLHLPTRTLSTNTPALFNLNALNFAYDAKAPAPLEWTHFLNTLWGDDHEAISTLQEFCGLALTAETRHQKALMMVGPKRCGKGTIGRVLTALVGQANVCAPTLSSLAQNFGLEPLIGKRLAIIADARLSPKADPQIIGERILTITGEDGLTIDRKFRTGWTGRLQTRFVIMTNELPKLTDASGALASRFVVLTLQKSFFGKEDLGLTDRLTAELPGILRWALDGWDRLQKRGHFQLPKSSRQAQEELEELGSPIGAFVREWCTVEPGASVACSRLYEEWTNWCREQNRDYVGTVQEFGRNLRTVVPGVRVTNNRQPGAGGRLRTYEGVRAKTYQEQEDQQAQREREERLERDGTRVQPL